jgi:hypothetical protein
MFLDTWITLDSFTGSDSFLDILTSYVADINRGGVNVNVIVFRQYCKYRFRSTLEPARLILDTDSEGSF